MDVETSLDAALDVIPADPLRAIAIVKLAFGSSRALWVVAATTLGVASDLVLVKQIGLVVDWVGDGNGGQGEERSDLEKLHGGFLNCWLLLSLES